MTTTEQVARMRLDGVRRTEVATQLGISINMVAREITKAREVGLLPPKQPGDFGNQMREAVKRHGIKKGSVQDVLALLTPEAREWLMKITPHGDTLASIMAAIVTDAHQEEVGE